ncbi:glucose-1-phosphate thymidylyltransferase [Taibaiella lutea]|uniref:Glucose-1-phosphate thymidylyltransferase n=1 Tax=Taibaiella lutea TaxID=2608001 RepID=A0A5M6CQ73_9BACT|nr:GlmU family protein [Taibaiella lutea]KAA5536530.1 glucose-1-phosphate thymidylyltransferase [Taibaiella lutea]
MHYILFDGSARNQFLPFTHTRPVADIRCGIMTMRQRWEHFTGNKTSTATIEYLQKVFPQGNDKEQIYINAAVFATPELFLAIGQLNEGDALISENILLAVRTEKALQSETDFEDFTAYNLITYNGSVQLLKKVWDIFGLNGKAIESDFTLLTKDRQSQPLPAYVTAINPSNIFVEEGAKIYPCIINAEAGPVYIGKDAEIMEGCIIRGAFAMCDHSVLKMASKVYSNTTLGPGCKVGGEVSNVVFFANSNKGHDGFLGNAVIGEWCNLGADSNCSNLKNNYDIVKIWDESQMKSVNTGLQFCGLMMGDHSKCGINTMFNTGTVVGVSCNLYGAGFPKVFVPSFSWGDHVKMVVYNINKAIETANRMMERRGLTLSEAEKEVLQHIFEQTENARTLMHVG